MTDLIGESCIPNTLIIPIKEGTFTGKRIGEVWISGNKLWFNTDGTNVDLVTSA